MKQEPLYITQHTPFIRDLQVKDSEGNPIDLTDFTAKMYIAKYFGSETRYQVAADVLVPLEGRLRISINSEGTGILPYGSMQYTIYLKPELSDQIIILYGPVVVIPTI